MNEVNFSLNPFIWVEPPRLKIEGKVSRDRNILKLNYLLSGDTELIQIPPHTLKPERQDELWQTTCFEFFVGLKDSPRYWEFNLSPSGNWNVYRFEDYRQGMAEESQISRLPFEVRSRDRALSLDVEFNLSAIIRETETLELAIATVIQTQTNAIGYWALEHGGVEADFHRRDSFVLLIH